MGFSLYEIDQAVLSVLENGLVFDEETGEVLFDEDNFEQLEGERNAKLEAVALYVKSLDAEAAAMKAEETALKKRRETRERKAERLRTYVADSMTLFGDPKIETARVALSFRKSEAVEITDANALRPDFWKYTAAVDKSAIKKAIKAGEVVEGAAIITRQNLQIK